MVHNFRAQWKIIVKCLWEHQVAWDRSANFPSSSSCIICSMSFNSSLLLFRCTISGLSFFSVSISYFSNRSSSFVNYGGSFLISSICYASSNTSDLV